jgi:predicted ATPase
MISRVHFNRFTAFEDLTVAFSPGINVFIGENGTGKTHLMKAVYAACDIISSKGSLATKINNVFYPSEKKIGRLVKRTRGRGSGWVEIGRQSPYNREYTLRLSISTNNNTPDQADLSGHSKQWMDEPLEAAFIPVKDMMAHAPGFSSLYEKREIHFEEIYVDIIRKALLPILKGPIDGARKVLLEKLQKAMQGKVVTKNEEFFLKSSSGNLEFTLLAEGFRKLGLLWVLIQNGTLTNGSALFWDEPETNLNPKLIQAVVGILLELQLMGVQIFVTTHDYIVLKEFDLQSAKEHQLRYHSLYRDTIDKEIHCQSTDTFDQITHNAILQTFGDVLDRHIQREMRQS